MCYSALLYSSCLDMLFSTDGQELYFDMLSSTAGQELLGYAIQHCWTAVV